MDSPSQPESAFPANGSGRRLWWGLFAISLVFLAWRTPVMYREPGGMDECYAVPGLTIVQDGLPRLPHAPARNPESVFYGAEILLFAEPPLSFYYQALFYALLPDVYGTGRLSSAVAGIVLFVLLARLGSVDGLPVRAILWGLGLYSVSRWFYFLAIAARPDVLCTVFGVAACLAAQWWEKTQQRRWLFVTGLAIGAGGLTHPFAIIYALQIAAWVAWSTRGWNRLIAPALVTAVSLATASLWLLLIVQQPEIFLIQFRNQFLQGSDKPLLLRLLWPWDAVAYHFELQQERVGAWQFALAVVGWLTLGVVGWRERQAALVRLWWLTGTAAWLIVGLVGTHHPVFGYWTYPAALAFLGLGVGIDRWLRVLRFPVIQWAAAAMLVASMLPGSGIRTLLAHLKHWDDIRYNAPRLSQWLLSRIPPDAVCMVDTEFSLDFIAAQRPTLMSETLPMYFRADQFEYDYLIVSRQRSASGLPQQLHGRLVETLGVKDDVFACYAEIYVPDRKADSAEGVPSLPPHEPR
jgi:hypothetical protein